VQYEISGEPIVRLSNASPPWMRCAVWVRSAVGHCWLIRQFRFRCLLAPAPRPLWRTLRRQRGEVVTNPRWPLVH
jgi:hypothetical protein